MISRATSTTRGLAFFGLLALTLPVTANELETRISVALEVNDNIFATGTNTTTELIRTPKIDVNYLYEFSDVTASLVYQIAQEDYRDNTFSDRLDLTGEAIIDWSVIDNRLTWQFNHRQNKLSINNEFQETPDNQVDRSIFSTGPKVTVLSGANQVLMIEADYLETKFDDDSRLDLGETPESQRVNYRVNYQQSIGPGRTVGAFADVSDIKFNTGQPGYQNERFGLSFTGGAKWYGYELQYGQNKLDRSVGQKISNPFYSALVSIKGESWELSLRGNRQLTDTSLGLSQDSQVGDNLDTGDRSLGNQDVVQRYRYEMAASKRLQKLSFSLGISLDEQEYQTLNQDERTESVDAKIEYRLSQRVRVSYLYSFERNEFIDTLGRDDEFDIEQHRVSFSYSVNQNLKFDLVIEKESRGYELQANRDHKVNNAILTVSYRI